MTRYTSGLVSPCLHLLCFVGRTVALQQTGAPPFLPVLDLVCAMVMPTVTAQDDVLRCACFAVHLPKVTTFFSACHTLPLCQGSSARCVPDTLPHSNHCRLQKKLDTWHNPKKKDNKRLLILTNQTKPNQQGPLLSPEGQHS